jgi:hypothetical protein
MASSVFFASDGDTPFAEGMMLTEEGERARVQPASGGSPVWMPRSSVFRKSPDAPGMCLPLHAQAAPRRPQEPCIMPKRTGV